MTDRQRRYFEANQLPYGELFKTAGGRIMKLGVHEPGLKDVTSRRK